MLNKQTGNMYAWITHTWNPIKGNCPHACSYCYMKRWDVGELRLDPKELKTNLKSENVIFIGSGTDAFCEQVPGDWIERVLSHCQGFDNRYLFQSKNPARFKEFIGSYPENTILGTTLETDHLLDGVSSAPGILERVDAMRELSGAGFVTMLTIEPVIDFDPVAFLDLLRDCNPAWVNIGADSKRNRLPEPSSKKVEQLLSGIKSFTRVHAKRNLDRLMAQV